MGDINQQLFVERHAERVHGPILEVGSHDYGSTCDFRGMHPGVPYVGVDMNPGKGVDVVVDLSGDFADIDARLSGQRFNTVICFSVLEHCAQPFRMAENITRLTAPGGWLIVGVPFSFQVHAYPNDYWRFTDDGIRVLFPAFQFDPADCVMATSKAAQMKPVSPFMYRAELSVSAARRRKEYGPLRGLMLRLVRRARLFPFIFDYPHLHPPVCINMLGRRRSD